MNCAEKRNPYRLPWGFYEGKICAGREVLEWIMVLLLRQKS